MNEKDCSEEVTVTIFPPIPGVGIIEEEPVVEDEDSCGDSSISHLTPSSLSGEERSMALTIKDPMAKIQQLLGKAKEIYGERICIRIANYDNIDEAIEWLNAAVRGSGNPAYLDREAVSSFLGASAPIISINNRLSFVGMVPNESQFLSRLNAAFRLVENRTQ